MKLIKILSLSTMMVAFSINAATLVPAKGVSVLYINGQEAESKIGKNNIDPGMNQVIVRMDKDLGRGSSSSVYTSEPFVLTFDVSGEEIKLNHPVARSKAEAEKAFRSNNPEWRLSQDGNALAYDLDKLSGKKGLLPFMGMDGIVEDYNSERGITFVDGKLVTATTASAAVVATSASAEKEVTQTSATQVEKNVVEQPKAVEPQTVEQLKAWYKKATKAEQKEFRKWMIDQE
ncbi:DUF2057 domain-containing protein [Vibrio sp. SCSIO 43135]|uniref:YccT family protein n=1 Tax=Vibrio sp. SCSIO 43135 TaxID=2819096 RepID=UPI002075E5B9|nr:DUF2057 domain-containing protein [Vibrio sp. SCSIO 43135]